MYQLCCIQIYKKSIGEHTLNVMGGNGKKIGLLGILGCILFMGCVAKVYAGNPEELKQSLHYRKVLEQVWAHWPPQFEEIKQKEARQSPGVHVRAWETSGDPDYIGLQKKMLIQAPIERVDEIVCDFEHYSELFPEFKNVKVISRGKSEWVTHWVRPIPFPFVPDVYYETAYQTDRSQSDRKVFKIKLKESNRVWVSDDLLVLDRKGPSQTEFSVLSFFEADWGPVRILGMAKIWKDSIEGSILSDLSFKLKAEHPDWSPEKIKTERVKLVPDHYVDDVFDQRQIFALEKLIPSLKPNAVVPQVEYLPSPSPTPRPSAVLSSPVQSPSP